MDSLRGCVCLHQDGGDVVEPHVPVGGVDEAVAPDGDVKVWRAEDGRDLRRRHHVGEAVGAEKQNVARFQRQGGGVDGDGGGSAERADQDVLHRVADRLLGGHEAAGQVVVDERVVGGDLREAAVAKAIEAAVAGGGGGGGRGGGPPRPPPG